MTFNQNVIFSKQDADVLNEKYVQSISVPSETHHVF